MRPTFFLLGAFVLNVGFLVEGQQYNPAFNPGVNALPQAQGGQFPQQGFAPPQGQDTYSTVETHDDLWLKPGEDFNESHLKKLNLKDAKDDAGLEFTNKDKFKDVEDKEENSKKHDKKDGMADDEDRDDEGSGKQDDDGAKSSDKASVKQDSGKQDDRVNKRFMPLMRIPLFINKPFYPWMKHSYCFHPVCHVPGMKNGFKGWQKKFLAAYIVIKDIMYLAYRC